MKTKSGGKISNDELHHFINASYSKGKDYKNWKLDHSLSDASVQVYFNGQDAVVVHRGSQDAQDWKENALTAIGLKSGQKRLEHSRKIQKKAEAKYGAKNVITIGHSKGAYHAEEVGQNSREIYTLNKPVTPYDLLYKKVPSHQTDIRSGLDPVSILRPLQRGNEHENILSRTLNPLTEHLGSVLNRVNPSKWWGRGRCWKGYEPVPGKKPYSKGSCRKTGGIIRTEAQYLLAVSVLKRLLNERHLLDEEKDDLEEKFNDVKNFFRENGDDLNFPDAIKFKVVLELMIKKKIMTKQARSLLNEYFAEEEEERYSDDFETFDEKTGKGRRRRKSGAGSGASVIKPPSGEQIPVERVEERREVNEPVNFSGDFEELHLLASQIMDYIEGNKALTQARKEWFEQTIPKIKHLLLKLPQDEDEFLVKEQFFHDLKEILLIVKPRKKMGNQLRDQIDEILSILNQFEIAYYGDFEEGAGLYGAGSGAVIAPYSQQKFNNAIKLIKKYRAKLEINQYGAYIRFLFQRIASCVEDAITDLEAVPTDENIEELLRLIKSLLEDVSRAPPIYENKLVDAYNNIVNRFPGHFLAFKPLPVNEKIKPVKDVDVEKVETHLEPDYPVDSDAPFSQITEPYEVQAYFNNTMNDLEMRVNSLEELHSNLGTDEGYAMYENELNIIFNILATLREFFDYIQDGFDLSLRKRIAERYVAYFENVMVKKQELIEVENMRNAASLRNYLKKYVLNVSGAETMSGRGREFGLSCV